MTHHLGRALTRRKLLKTSTFAAIGTLAAPSILRAQSSELVIGCAGSHTSWMETIVTPHMKEAIGAEIIFEGTKSSVNLEKMSSNKDAPYLSVVQMDDPVMIQAVEADLLTPITPDAVPNMTDLRPDATYMEGMWCNYVQPWAGIAYNTDKADGVPSWTALWGPANAGQIIIPSLQNTEGMWTLMSAAMLGSGLPFSEAQYEIDAAFAKLEELKPNLLTVYTTMSQAFNLLEQGEISMLSGNFSSYTLPRKPFQTDLFQQRMHAVAIGPLLVCPIRSFERLHDLERHHDVLLDRQPWQHGGILERHADAQLLDRGLTVEDCPYDLRSRNIGRNTAFEAKRKLRVIVCVSRAVPLN